MFYTFKNNLKNVKDAFDLIMATSMSLEGSDLSYFRDCRNIFDIERVLKSGDLDDSWAHFGTMYYKSDWWVFRYSTYTGTNQISIVSRGSDGPVYVYYHVDSYSGIYDSSAAKSALLHGWTLGNQNNIDWSLESLAKKRKILAKKRHFRKNGPSLEMRFGVYFEEIHGTWHVLSHVLRVDPEQDIENVQLVPEYAAHFRVLAEKELEQTFVAPDEYEYNELIRKGGEDSFYAQKFREYQAGLRKLIAVCEELEKITPQAEVQLTVEPKPKRSPRKPRAERENRG